MVRSSVLQADAHCKHGPARSVAHHPLARRRLVPQAATAALLLGAPLAPAALAGEFDLLAEGTPSTYVLDDAGILNKTTKKSVGDQLKALEVGGHKAVCGAPG